MKKKLLFLLSVPILTVSLLTLGSCLKNDLNRSPDITPLTQGFKASSAIGYCVSLATTAFTGGPLPPNVTFNPNSASGYTSSGVLHVHVTKDYPLPFNSSIGDIYIAGLWDGTNGGVISILFGDFDLLTAAFKFYGIYTVPISKNTSTGMITTLFAEQDIIIGQGQDTLLNLSLSKPFFNEELLRLNNGPGLDVFAMVKQNVWFINIDQKGTLSDVYDDEYKLSGGGQIASAGSNSGGILYHALLNTKFSYSQCNLNPFSGTGFIQNLQASGSSVDLGNITFDFHSNCDGRAQVLFATGKYISNNGQFVTLNWH